MPNKPIKQICRELRVSRNTVRKVIRSGATELTYERTIQPLPKIGPWKDMLDEMLAVNARKPKRERLTRIRNFEELRARGYDGGYDAVRRYAASWSKEEEVASVAAYVPLTFDPGEAYQFDWSHDVVLINGTTVTVKVAHVRLCHSRMLFVRAYPRETQEMVFDAHDRAFAFFKGTCTRGIYDNMKTPPLVRGQWTRRPRSTRSSSAVTEPTTAGSSRCAATTSSIRRPLGLNQWRLNERPCTPASGWEKGQVENQVGVVRRRFFVPRPKFKSYAELNDAPCCAIGPSDNGACWRIAVLSGPRPTRTRSFGIERSERCSKTSARVLSPTSVRSTIAWQAHRKAMLPGGGFHAVPASVSKTCLVRFDKNRYSVDGRAVGRPVEIRAYAERVEFWQDGKIVGQHARAFGRDKAIYDPLHYIPVLARKPGALRNGAPFKDWDLPSAIRRVQRNLGKVPNGDRQMVQILCMIPIDGLDAVDAACAEALSEGVPAASVVINILAEHREPPPPLTIDTPAALLLTCEPAADCKRYDSLRRPNHGKITSAGRVTPKACLRHDEPAEALRHEGRLR